MPRTRLRTPTEGEVEELRRGYGDLALALARKWNYRPEGLLDLGRDFIELTGSIDQAVLAQDFERVLGIKADSALERILREAAERGVEFENLLTALEQFQARAYTSRR